VCVGKIPGPNKESKTLPTDGSHAPGFWLVWNRYESRGDRTYLEHKLRAEVVECVRLFYALFIADLLKQTART